MKVFLIIFVLISFSLVSNEDSQYAKTIRETAKSMGYQLTEEELEAWIERLKSYNSNDCLLYTSPSPRDKCRSRMPSSA